VPDRIVITYVSLGIPVPVTICPTKIFEVELILVIVELSVVKVPLREKPIPVLKTEFDAKTAFPNMTGTNVADAVAVLLNVSDVEELIVTIVVPTGIPEPETYSPTYIGIDAVDVTVIVELPLVVVAVVIKYIFSVPLASA